MPGRTFSGSSAWAARSTERRKTRQEKKDKRKDVRGKKKTARKESRAAVKAIRSKGKPGAQRRGEVLATKAYHKTDKEGTKGGMKAFGKFSGSKRAARIGEAAKRQKARRESREKRQAARKGLKD